MGGAQGTGLLYALVDRGGREVLAFSANMSSLGVPHDLAGMTVAGGEGASPCSASCWVGDGRVGWRCSHKIRPERRGERGCGA